MHKEDIKAALRKKYGTLRKFESKMGLPGGSTKDVLRGRAVAQTERAIAEALNKKLHVVFPTRYAPTTGTDSSTEVDNIATAGSAHRLSKAVV